MAYWLLKTEPDCYNWKQLESDKKTCWDGVANALALKHIRTMAKGDLALIYHTGSEKAAVGIVEVVSLPYADPNEGDAKLAVVDVKIVGPLARHVTLSDIKADPTFAGWDLIRNARLSVVPVPTALWERVRLLGSGLLEISSPKKQTVSGKSK